MAERIVVRKREELHPYEYLLLNTIRNAGNGELTIKFQDGLPMMLEETKRSRIDFRKNAIKQGLIKEVS
jgi:hypothetical protein